VIFVIPAQSPGLAKAGPGNQLSVEFWVPACAGMTKLEIGKLIRDYSVVTDRIENEFRWSAFARLYTPGELSVERFAKLMPGRPRRRWLRRLRIVTCKLYADWEVGLFGKTYHARAVSTGDGGWPSDFLGGCCAIPINPAASGELVVAIPVLSVLRPDD